MSPEEIEILAAACENQESLRVGWGKAPPDELERYQHAMVSLLRRGYVNLYSVRMWNPQGNDSDERVLGLNDAVTAALDRANWLNPNPNPDPQWRDIPEIEVYGTLAGVEALKPLAPIVRSMRLGWASDRE